VINFNVIFSHLRRKTASASQKLVNALKSNNPAQQVLALKKSGELFEALPEIEIQIGFDQKNPHHHLDLFNHTLATLANVSKLTDNFSIRLAALLHDIGKPETAKPKEKNPKIYGFHGHPDIGADKAVIICRRLGISEEETKLVSLFVKLHQTEIPKNQRALRKFVERAGGHDLALDILHVMKADRMSHHPDHNNTSEHDEVRDLITKDRDAEKPTFKPRTNLPISGKDIADYFGKPQGPWLEKIIKFLRSRYDDNPDLTKEDMIKMLYRFEE